MYMLASRSRNLYVGVTNDLGRRMNEHRLGVVPGFTTRYRIFRLVHFELFGDIRAAIAREKEIKGWRREKKVWLIKRGNPTWEDLAVGLGIAEKQIPHRHSPKAGDWVRDDSAAADEQANRRTEKQIPHRRSPKNGDRVRDDSRSLA